MMNFCSKHDCFQICPECMREMNTQVSRNQSPNAVSPDILVPIAGSAPGQCATEGKPASQEQK